MKLRVIIFGCYILMMQQHVYAQISERDSLIVLVNKLPENKEKIEVLLRLSELLRGEPVSESAQHARMALWLADKLSYDEGKGRSYYQLAREAKSRDDFLQTKVYFDSALFYFQDEDQLKYRGMVLNQLGILEFELNNFDASRNYYDQALEVYEQINDSTRIANEYLNIGITYEMQGLHAIALDYYFKCLAIDEKLGDEAGIASDYMSIGLIFKRQNDFESAIRYYEMSLELSEAMNDAYSTAGVLTNLGVIYKDQGRLQLALETQEKALEVFRSMDHGRGLMTVHHNIAVIYYKTGQLSRSEEYINNSNEIAMRLNSRYVSLVNDILQCRIYLQRGSIKEASALAGKVITGAEELGLLTEKFEVMELLSQIYIADGRADLALETMVSSNILKDSIYNLEKGRQMQELQTKYETAQKENVIELLNKEKALQESELSRKTLQQNMILGGIALLSLVGFIAFRSYTFRQKQKQLLLDQQLKSERMEADRLQELDEAKSRFFANIAHEFRTPLTLILGPSEQILQENHEPQIIDNAQMIRQNAGKLLSLTNQLLDLSKLESGMIKLQPIHSNFVSFVSACVFAFESMADEKEIRIVFHAENEKLIMDFDEEKASIMINNLMSNALKFTPPFGEVNVAVKPAMLSGGENFIELIVADTGMGIAAEQLPFIFDRFFQADDSLSRKTQGTGIGLALTKELAELHRGTIEVHSTPGKGTTFTVSLPLVQENASTETQELRKNMSSANTLWLDEPVDKNDLSAASTENKKTDEAYTILVVEDNPEVRNFIVGVLGNDYHVIEADNGQSGLEKTIEMVPDLVITDLMMPVMDGYQYCRNVKEDERTSHIPVIMLTAKDSLDHKVDGFETGVDDYLTKPFHARELLARIKNLIKSRNALHEKYNKSKDPTLFEKKEHAFITKLKQIIDENIDQETFNVVDLGRALAMSRTQVHRKLKALTNLSTSQFIRNHKLIKAMDLLQSGSYNVSDVAYMLGFNTPNYFSTCFNEYFGFSPSEATKSIK